VKNTKAQARRRESNAAASSVKPESEVASTTPKAGETGIRPLSKRKQAIMRAHTIRRLHERELFDCLCKMERPQPIATLRGGRAPGFEHTILRAVDSYGAYHLFIHRPEEAPENQTHPCTDREAIEFIIASAMPECLAMQAHALINAGAKALDSLNKKGTR
jgi:hypothetical protein